MARRAVFQRRQAAWARTLARALWLGLALALPARATEQPEYRLKAAFLYNFAAFTEWPADAPVTIQLCIVGADPFGKEIDLVRGKAFGARSLAVQLRPVPDALAGCQMVFVSAALMPQLPRLLDTLRGRPVLTVADSPGAVQQGVALNMVVQQGRVAFEANLTAARGAGLDLSSKLLRLATEVIQ
ncbi:MAG: YfiR family protein [Burkholderiaceae bacterium]